jgi:uncharacterized protein (TIGR02285 family)
LLRLAALCLVVILLASPSEGRAQSVAWVSSAPPMFADGDETMDSGQIDYLIRSLPQFTHHISRVSAARSLYDLQHGEGMCSVGILVTPERESFTVFTRRRMALPNVRLMVTRERLADWKAMLTPKGEVDLQKVGDSLTGGFTNSRHYDPVIADFIQQRGGQHMESLVATFQLFNLLQAGRIDFAFVMPPDLFFYGAKLDRKNLVLLPVKGVAPTSDAGVACTQDETGRAVVKAIDTWLADDGHWAEFVEPYRAWVPAEDYVRIVGGRSNIGAGP